jgi:hypothetical protein
MIVRIMTDNQYRIDDGHSTEIARLDNELMDAVEAHDDRRFHATLDQLIQHVRQNGQVVPDDEVVPSDMMVPAPDMTLDEAHELVNKPVAPEPGRGDAQR